MTPPGDAGHRTSRLSVWLTLLMATLPDHGHCEVCGRVVDVGERWCGAECREKHAAIIKKKKRDAAVFVAVVALLLIVVSVRGGSLF